MFDFEKLLVYQKSTDLIRLVNQYIEKNRLPIYLKDQLQRSSLSICLNIAEGTGRIAWKDRRRFYIMARGSVYECAAILQLLLELKRIDSTASQEYKSRCAEISKMLFGLIKNLEKRKTTYQDTKSHS